MKIRNLISEDDKSVSLGRLSFWIVFFWMNAFWAKSFYLLGSAEAVLLATPASLVEILVFLLAYNLGKKGVQFLKDWKVKGGKDNE